MLSSISWPQYFAAAILLAFSYYVYVFLRYYRANVNHFFNRHKSAARSAANLQSSPFTLIGAVKSDQLEVLDNEADLQFADAIPDQLPDIHTQAISAKPITPDQPSPAEELEVEAGKLIKAFMNADDKSGFPQLLKILIEPSKRFPDQADVQAVMTRILRDVKERLSFSLTLSDLGLNGNN